MFSTADRLHTVSNNENRCGFMVYDIILMESVILLTITSGCRSRLGLITYATIYTANSFVLASGGIRIRASTRGPIDCSKGASRAG